MNRIARTIWQWFFVGVALVSVASHVWGSGQTYVHADVMLWLVAACVLVIALVGVQSDDL